MKSQRISLFPGLQRHTAQKAAARSTTRGEEALSAAARLAALSPLTYHDYLHSVGKLFWQTRFDEELPTQLLFAGARLEEALQLAQREALELRRTTTTTPPFVNPSFFDFAHTPSLTRLCEGRRFASPRGLA